MNYLFKNGTLMPMDYFLNQNVLIQIESKKNEKGENVFYVVIFFRHSHKVFKSHEYKEYQYAKNLYENMKENNL